MPLPVKPNETKEEFISKCMKSENESFPDNKQRAAVCFSKWKEHMKKSSMDDKDTFMKDCMSDPKNKSTDCEKKWKEHMNRKDKEQVEE